MSSDKPVYRPLPEYADTAEVDRVLESGTWDELMVLPLALGSHWPDWKYAQAICLGLADHVDPAIRANACLGLAYVARTQRNLERDRVEPVLLRELAGPLPFSGRVQDAIDDINTFLKWGCGPQLDNDLD
jgi:hypothetical protein